mmetsp:Transcript_18636/g.39956  ORF Transcript_18636/g.39956 Transcript_18636/m.39956 type:complete len:102 (+) Transcript_18636:1066-1371(+)
MGHKPAFVSCRQTQNHTCHQQQYQQQPWQHGCQCDSSSWSSCRPRPPQHYKSDKSNKPSLQQGSDLTQGCGKTRSQSKWTSIRNSSSSSITVNTSQYSLYC